MPAGQNYIPGIFRSKSPKLPECTNPNQDLSGLLSLSKPALQISLDKNTQVCVRGQNLAGFVQLILNRYENENPTIVTHHCHFSGPLLTIISLQLK